MELFQNSNWLAVHIGQLNWPRGYDPLVDQRGIDWRGRLASLRRVIGQAADAMPTHAEYVRNHCGAPETH